MAKYTGFKNLAPIVLALLLTTTIFGQTKNEREYRIKKKQFPEKALKEMETELPEASRTKYYIEIDNDAISYEAKLKLNGKLYSVEFNANGDLEDIEILIEKNEVPQETLRSIESYFDSYFKKHRIIKIQRQYLARIFKNETFRFADQDKITDDVRYEIVVAGRKEEGFEHYEMRFAANGAFIDKRKFVSLGYDHILY